jgi:hypothetical protein
MTFKDRERQTREFFSIFSQHTEMKIDILLIHHDSLFNRALGKRLLVGSGIEIARAYRVCKDENLWWKNAVRKENVYVAWSRGQSFNIATVDDIMGEYVERFRSKNHFLLVQTSQKKFQGYFLLDRYVDYQTLHKVQKVLCKVYNGDTGALSPVQLKRCVGFENTKYGDGFIVRIVHQGSNVVNVDKVLSLYRKWFEKTRKTVKKRIYKREKKYSLNDEKFKCWKDFECEDLSRADMRYVCYLIGVRGLSDEEIYDLLLSESPDIERRHKVEDYIPRTIAKARDEYGVTPRNGFED